MEHLIYKVFVDREENSGRRINYRWENKKIN